MFLTLQKQKQTATQKVKKIQRAASILDPVTDGNIAEIYNLAAPCIWGETSYFRAFPTVTSNNKRHQFHIFVFSYKPSKANSC